jgi:hypothetical protein
VNINQTKKTTTKRKPRENNKPPQNQYINMVSHQYAFIKAYKCKIEKGFRPYD